MCLCGSDSVYTCTFVTLTVRIQFNGPAADREPKLKIPARITPGLGLGRNQLKIRLNRLKLVQNNPNSFNSNKGISVILNEFKVVAATAILNYVNMA